jgi:tetratricopeptide (TPR) repeat protein
MKPDLQALKKQFREGRHREAIAECEAWCRKRPADLEIKRLCAMMHALVHNYSRSLELLLEIRERDPDNADVLFNIGMCERELKNFEGAAHQFQIYTEKFASHPDGWTSLAECRFHLGEFNEGIALAERAIGLDASSVPAWTVRGNCQQSIGQFENAVGSFTKAIELAPNLAELRVHRGDAFDRLGSLDQAAADYQAALAQVPTDDQVLKKASVCLLHLDRGHEAIQLCRDILKVHPDSLTAKLGAEWLLSQLVPLWHIPMMNEQERNRAYYEGLQSVVTPEKIVFEIGTGSGLLAMMAAKLGARKVITCEAVRLVADTATRIIERNRLQDRITVLAKPSYAIQLEQDLPAKADILVHEIFSSELLGEQVLPAIEDAKARLLKPGGEILPAAASIMIALVSGDELGKELHVEEAFGFDLRPFNAIHPKKRPLHREDLPRILLSDDVEAFRFDFVKESTFSPEKKRIDLGVTKDGLCYGLIQWIRFEFGHGVVFENHPSRRGPANWQHTIYRFDEPLHLEQGAVIAIDAMHDRSRPWFDLADGGGRSKL